MNYYHCHHVYVTKKRGERDSDCAEFCLYNTPLPYKSSAETSIIVTRELAYALQNPAPQAPFSNIGEYQLVTLEKLSKLFTKAADDRKSTTDPQKSKQITHPLVYQRNHSQDGLNILRHHSPMSLKMKRG